MTYLTATKGFVTYNIELKPITPIHVWSGVDAKLRYDAFIDGNYLYVVKPEYLEDLPREDLIQVIKEFEKKPEDVAIKVFELLKKKGHIKPVAEVKGAAMHKPGTIIKLIHENLVPGSTLKGYIRTSIMRYFLLDLQKNRSELVKIIKSGVNTSKGPKKMGEGLEASLFRRPRTREQGGFLDVLELVKVSDPEVQERKLSLRELRVVHVDDPNAVIARIPAITLDPVNRPLRFKITFDARQIPFENVDFKQLKEEISTTLKDLIKLRNDFAKRFERKEELLRALQQHGCYLIEAELSKLSRSPKASKALIDYVNLLEEVKKKLCEKSVNCVPARIGFMTGHEAKTVLDIIKENEPLLYGKIVDVMQKLVKREWDAKTLKLVEVDGKLFGVGWCELCVE